MHAMIPEILTIGLSVLLITAFTICCAIIVIENRKLINIEKEK